MSNYAKTVLWLGLFMIAAGVMRNWSLISATVFGSSSSAPSKPGTTYGGTGPASPGGFGQGAVGGGKGR